MSAFGPRQQMVASAYLAATLMPFGPPHATQMGTSLGW